MNTKTKRTLSMLTAVIMSTSALAMTGCSDSEVNSTEAAETVTTADIDEGEAAPAAYINEDWSYGQVAIGGGGYVTGIISTNEAGLFYCKTDVGGAYRWDDEAQTWVSMSYHISDDEKGLLGIDGIAVDPNNAANVYLCAGTSYFSNAMTCILISHDYGETFEQVDVSDLIKVHGNGMGRGNGERIAVDPNNSDIIYCGGRTGGMIRSTDGGKTWESVSSFPVSSTTNGNGINIILFDGAKSSDGKTTRIYAGISESKTDNIYYSDDAGETWSALPCLTDEAKEFMPQRFDLDSKGSLFVSYGRHEGPYNSGEGALYKYNLDDNTANDISCISQTTGDIVIDPNNDNNIVLVSSQVWTAQPNGAYGDQFYRSTDGGETWQSLEGSYTMSTNDMDWIANAAIHWCSSLAMDSGSSDRILVNSGNGVFACDNIWDDVPEFYFEAKGIEEIVPMDMVSYKDYPLVSAALDYDGFVHEDITVSAQRHTKQFGSCTSIAIAAQNHDVWAKVGGDESIQKLAYSLDGGQTWTDITTKPDPDKNLYQGTVGLTADGSALLWSPSNGTYSYRTEDWGKTWEKIDGIVGAKGVYFVSDNVNKDYVYGSCNGVFYVSSDGGKSFSRKYDTANSYKRIAVDPDAEGKVYIAGGGSGLLVTNDHGDNLSLVSGLKYCEAVSLGKPRNNGDPYVIYVYGTPMDSDVKGLYMSEDEGGSWERINDDLHQFGGTGNGAFVCGDMNVYGRCYMSTVGLGIVYCDKNEK